MIPPGIEECQACGETWYAGRCYLQCAECGHVYRTRWHLLAAVRRNLWRARHFRGALLNMEPLGISWWRILLGGPWLPSKVYSCQCCTHDF